MDNQGNKPVTEDWELIYSYTRAQAIEDGELVDVGAFAPTILTEAGIKVPLALTREVWGKYVELPEGVEGQDVTGRLWDILTMFRHGVKLASPNSDTIHFLVSVRNDNRSPRTIRLKAMIHPGDKGEPVITIMLPEED